MQRVYELFFSRLFWYFWGKMITGLVRLMVNPLLFFRHSIFYFLGLQFPFSHHHRHQQISVYGVYRFEVLLSYYYYFFFVYIDFPIEKSLMIQGKLLLRLLSPFITHPKKSLRLVIHALCGLCRFHCLTMKCC